MKNGKISSQRDGDCPANRRVRSRRQAWRSLRDHRYQDQGQGNHPRNQRRHKEASEVVSTHSDIRQAGASTPIPGGPSPQSLDAHGSSVTLEFDKYVPEITGDQVRAMLAPVFDFKALTGTEAYQKTLPPKSQAAIATTRSWSAWTKRWSCTPRAVRSNAFATRMSQGEDYEEWIYGKPPEEVEFVRFKGNEVARLEIMTVDGKKTVRTEREVDLPAKDTEVAEKKPAPKPQARSHAAPSGRGARVSRDPRPRATTAPQDPSSANPTDTHTQTAGTSSPGTAQRFRPPRRPSIRTPDPHLAPASLSLPAHLARHSSHRYTV